MVPPVQIATPTPLSAAAPATPTLASASTAVETYQQRRQRLVQSPPSPRQGQGQVRAAEVPLQEMDGSALQARVVAQLVAGTTEVHIPVSEEDIDLGEPMEEQRKLFEGEEFEYLRDNGSYDVWTDDEVQAFCKDNETSKLDTRWVITSEKARLVTRDYNPYQTMAFYAATQNPMTRNCIPTIAVKRGYRTATLDARRAYLQVPEEAHVFIKPPKERSSQPDYKEGSWWKARTKWYGERGAAQAWVE